jgi:hypothetical protein
LQLRLIVAAPYKETPLERRTSTRNTFVKTIPFRALMPAKTAPARYEFISPFLEERGLGIGDSPFLDLKGPWE